MEDHRLLAPGVTITVYANGAETVVNRSDAPFAHRGFMVAPGDWRRF